MYCKVVKTLWEKVKEIEERLQRVKEEREKIEREISSLPEGHIDAKKIGNNVYYYLRYWEDGKLRSKYIGKEGSEIVEKVKLSNELKKRLVLLREEERRLERALEKVKNAVDV